jgi:hypothetical protein
VRDAAHTHKAAPAARGDDHGREAMGAHMREMDQAIAEMRATLDRAQNVDDSLQLRTALDEVRAQLDAIQDSMARCKKGMTARQ